MMFSGEETRQLKIALKLAVEVLEPTIRANQRLLERARLDGHTLVIAAYESGAAQLEEHLQILKNTLQLLDADRGKAPGHGHKPHHS